MQKPQTWRELLSRHIENPQERVRIAAILEINPVTLTRWVRQESTPRSQHLQRLLDALPEERELLLTLIRQAFPGFSTVLEDSSTTDESATIPVEFYDRVIHTLATVPKDLHFWSLCDLIMRQVLLQLDPQRLGMAVIVARCMPPAQGNKVRSLREVIGCGTPPWESTLESYLMLLGAESLAGYVVSMGRPMENQNLREQSGLRPGYPGKWEESAVAAPIMFASGIAGCLLISSTQPDYFIPPRRALVERYAELIALVFDRQEFYGLEQIALSVLPSFEVQQPFFSGFRQRVIDIMSQALRSNQPLSSLQAEQLAWQQLEEELLKTVTP
jgi:hypothetical protein